MLDEIIAQNPWWREKAIDKNKIGSIERRVFGNLKKTLNSGKVACLIGPRRAGKTTLMYMLMDRLVKNGTKPENIFYVSADNAKTRMALEQDFDSIIKDYVRSFVKVEISSLKEKIFVFIDEVHKLKDWGNQVKYWHDLGLNIKFIVSGSSALRLLKGVGESLLGRIEFVHVYPLSFSEYTNIYKRTQLDFEKISDFHKQLLLEKEKILLKLDRYMITGGYPEVHGLETEKSFLTLREYKTLTINRDILELREIKETRTLSDLLDLLTDHMSNRINYSTFSNILKIKVETAKKFMEYLEEAFLISTSYLYSKTHILSTRKEKKLYFTDVGLRNSLLIKEVDEGEKAKIAENIVFSNILFNNMELLPKSFYWLDKNKNEVDMITLIEKTPVPIEVKYSNRIEISDLKGMKMFMKKFKTKTGIVVTKDILEKKSVVEGNLFLIPLWLFLLIDLS